MADAFPATMALARGIVQLDARDIPPSELRLARLRILDSFALLCAGYDTDAAQIARSVATANGGHASDGQGASVVSEAALWRPAWAAFAHGVIAHCRDFDDTFPDSVIHPGSTVVSTAFALGEVERLSDDDLLAAIVIGYEVAARLGRAGGRHLHARGFHASGVYGPVIAAAVASRVLRLNVEATANALGLACSMGGGLLEFLADGSWSKWLHVGWSAFGGIVAAQMAQQGFRGPTTGLEGQKGLYAAFAGAENVTREALAEPLGHAWRGGNALPKYFPCAHVNQLYISAALAMRAQLPAPDAIEQVTCVIAPWAVPIVCEPLATKQAPQSEMDVMSGLPFLVAAALVDGEVGLRHLAPDNRARSDLRAMASRIGYRADDTLGRGFDGAIEIGLRDGDRHVAKTAELGLDEARLTSKCESLISGCFEPDAARMLVRRISTDQTEPLCRVWRDGLRGVTSRRMA